MKNIMKGGKTKNIMPYIKIDSTVLYTLPTSEKYHIGVVTGIDHCKWKRTPHDNNINHSCYICKGKISIDGDMARCRCYDSEHCYIINIVPPFISKNEFEI